jgi:phosphoglycolate phosphatase-like HAD superfamily hydrolase
VNYTHIVFDVDGTLLDSEKTGLVSLQQTIRSELGKEMTLEELYPYFGIPSFQAVLRLGFEDPEKAAVLWEENFQALTYLTLPFEGIEHVLDSLHKKSIVMGVITSRNRPELDSDRHMLKWMPYFALTICAEDAPKPKPAPDPMWLFLEKTGADPANVLFVGDTSNDQICAHAAGTSFALALWGTRNGKDLPAEFYLEHPRDLLTL